MFLGSQCMGPHVYDTLFLYTTRLRCETLKVIVCVYVWHYLWMSFAKELKTKSLFLHRQIDGKPVVNRLGNRKQIKCNHLRTIAERTCMNTNAFFHTFRALDELICRRFQSIKKKKKTQFVLWTPANQGQN